LGPARARGFFYSDTVIVAVYFWAVIHDRSIWWACVAGHWTGRARPRRLPSQSQMSRRLRTPSVRRLIDALEERVLRAGRPAPLACAMDGKPLPVGPNSHDRNATWGYGAGGRAKGYKLHLLMALGGTVIAWRVAPMNRDEREMARRMLRSACLSGYILADALFDANHLHELASRHGGQLVAPRRMGSHRGLAAGRHSQARLRCKNLLENTVSPFGRELHHLRDGIERRFGYLSSTGGLLTHLPAWVRTYPRVRLWVQAKLVLAELRQCLRAQPHAA
jgi:hypothetical protein